MIIVELDRHNFEYDIHSLVQAFYPKQKVQVVYAEERERIATGDTAADEGEKEALPELIISLADKISVCILSRGETVRQESTEAAEDRIETKNRLKRLLYRMLSEYTGQKLPWGDLTGIRPTKIPMGLMEQGWTDESIAQYMRDTYYTGREKTCLAIEVAGRELNILGALYGPGMQSQWTAERGQTDLTRTFNREKALNSYSIYVGIPFCPSICLYCSFSSSPLQLWKDRVELYLDALDREIDAASELFSDKILNTLYIGGGTPTTLEPRQMDRLLGRLADRFSYDHLKEFTVEAGRPDSITREKLQVLLDHGVSRISINPQTMNQKTLDFIGRHHTVGQTEEAFWLAREMGFDNINMDLIVGLPGEEMPEVEYTMRELARLDPDSITVHSLAVKRAARLRLFKEEHKDLSMINSNEIMEMTSRHARSSGLLPYYLYRQKNMAGNFENVGYAKPGKEGLYNILIMEEVQSILALGAGASTKIVTAPCGEKGNHIRRIENVKDIKNYIERIDEMITRKRAGVYG